VVGLLLCCVVRYCWDLKIELSRVVLIGGNGRYEKGTRKKRTNSMSIERGRGV